MTDYESSSILKRSCQSETMGIEKVHCVHGKDRNVSKKPIQITKDLFQNNRSLSTLTLKKIIQEVS
jgi:hypothetical protein